jgi:hypothetical protein
LHWRRADLKRGLVTVDTPEAQALIGFVGGGAPPLANLRAAIETEFAAVVLVSLDGRPIARSGRLLLTATARVENSGMKWETDGRTIAEFGRPPMLIEPVAGKIVLAGLDPAARVAARPLSAVGCCGDAAIEAARSDDVWSFPIGPPHATTWYLVEVQRAKAE